MRRLNLLPRTPEWEEHRRLHRNASEASAMLDCNPYMKRSDLLHLKKTGERQEGNDFIFQKGHDAELAARPYAEEYLGEELREVVGVSEAYPWMSASFDGLTILGDIVWEHKLLNKNLVAAMKENDLPRHYSAQLDQQLLVSGASEAILTCSDGTPENMFHLHYTMSKDAEPTLVEGWRVFEEDLKAYIPAADNPAWMVVEDEYIEVELAIRDLVERQKKLKQDLIDMASGTSRRGNRITLSKIESPGSIQYKRIIEAHLPDLDIELFRGEPTTNYRVRVNNERDE